MFLDCKQILIFVFCGCSGVYSIECGCRGDVTKTIKISKMRHLTGVYRLEITGLDEPLVVPELVVHQHRLKEGIVLTEPQLEQLVVEAEMVRCEQTVSRMLGMREHTIGELRQKLKRKKFSENAINPAIKKHIAAGLLDDERLAHSLARRTYKRKPSGRSYLIATLRRKYVDRDLAARAVDNLLESQDEMAGAVHALQQKWPHPDQIDIESVRSKAYSYLSRRGFGYQAARDALTQLFEIAGKVAED